MQNYTYEDKCTMYLSDYYTMMYGFIGKHLIEDLGIEGEKALRKGTREFGYDRAEVKREKALKAGLKINMKTLFANFPDLPNDPRFRRELQELNEQERVSHTLRCTMAEAWDRYGHRKVGRIYCEEFHPACYSHYCFDLTQVNLPMTLTQDGDDHCDFNVVLRPENVPDNLKPVCFSEYDPLYVEPEIKDEPISAKDGFGSLSVKLYYYLFKCAVSICGEAGEAAIVSGLKEYASAAIDAMKEHAKEDALEYNEQYVHDNFPFDMDTVHDTHWTGYADNNSRKVLQKNLCDLVVVSL